MHSVALINLYSEYEFILILSFGQVHCERSFNKLKFIKSRFCSSIGNVKSDAFMLMNAEKELSEEVHIQKIIEYVKQSSPLMLKLLS